MKNEIRFTLKAKQRPKLAQEIGNLLGTAPHYERVPSCAYDIAGYRLNKEGVLHIPDGIEKEIVEDLIRQLREHGFQDDMEITEEVPVQQDKLTIAIPKESLTDTALENLQKIIANKQTLFQRAFRMDSTEIEITDEKINDLEESLGLEFRKEIREYLHQYGIIIGYGVEILGCGKNGESSLVKETERFRKLGLSDEYIVIRNSDEWIYCFNNNDGIISRWDRTEKTHLIKSNNFERYILDEMVDAKDEWD